MLSGDRQKWRRWAPIAGGLLLVLALGGWAGWNLTMGPTGAGADGPVIFFVPPGQGASQIASRLASEGLIRNATAFRLWARATRSAGQLKAGEYLLDGTLDTPAILRKLAAGQVILHPLTIPEGYNIAQIRALLVVKGWADADRFDQALAAAAAAGLIKPELLPAKKQLLIQPLEGYLFPDTYLFYRGITEAEIVRAMLARFRGTMTEERQAQAAALGMSVAEVLTLASIIEREAVRAEERSVISGVFHNRLRYGMLLGACPTVRYVMPDPTRPITSREMAIDHPYNTYVYAGLPPGPICSPGLASIDAALNPATTNYLYFVSKKDGSHAFARTYAEHLANIRRYPP